MFKLSTYIDFEAESKYKATKFKVGDHVRISKYKNIFAKGYTQNWSEEDFVIKKSQKYCTIEICNRGPSRRRNYWSILQKKVLQKKNQIKFRVEKI